MENRPENAITHLSKKSPKTSYFVEMAKEPNWIIHANMILCRKFDKFSLKFKKFIMPKFINLLTSQLKLLTKSKSINLPACNSFNLHNEIYKKIFYRITLHALTLNSPQLYFYILFLTICIWMHPSHKRRAATTSFPQRKCTVNYTRCTYVLCFSKFIKLPNVSPRMYMYIVYMYLNYNIKKASEQRLSFNRV